MTRDEKLEFIAITEALAKSHEDNARNSRIEAERFERSAKSSEAYAKVLRHNVAIIKGEDAR